MKPTARTVAIALFAAAGVLLLGFVVQVAAAVHSEIPPEKTWELLTAPALRGSLLQSAALGFFLAGWAALGTGFIRRNAGRRRRDVAIVAVCLLGSFAAFVWAAGRAADLMLPGRVCEAFDPDAYPGIIQVLGFRGHGSTLVGNASFEAWLEFKAGNVASFTDRTPPAAPGDETEALRAARAAFPTFRPDPSGRILAIRTDAKWEGWIVPGESPIRCVVLARRPRLAR